MPHGNLKGQVFHELQSAARRCHEVERQPVPGTRPTASCCLLMQILNAKRRRAQGIIGFQPILSLLGSFLVMLALLMLIPALADVTVGNSDWLAFVISALLTLFIGVNLTLVSRQRGPIALSRRQAFLLTSLVWVAAAAFGALPLAFAGLELSYTDAFFEAVSGITTTGSTVIVGLDTAPSGILLWRALLQWIGGIGFIAIGIAVLPALRIGGMQLFQAEILRTIGEDPAANHFGGRRHYDRLCRPHRRLHSGIRARRHGRV